MRRRYSCHQRTPNEAAANCTHPGCRLQPTTSGPPHQPAARGRAGSSTGAGPVVTRPGLPGGAAAWRGGRAAPRGAWACSCSCSCLRSWPRWRPGHSAAAARRRRSPWAGAPSRVRRPRAVSPPPPARAAPSGAGALPREVWAPVCPSARPAAGSSALPASLADAGDSHSRHGEFPPARPGSPSGGRGSAAGVRGVQVSCGGAGICGAAGSRAC